MRRTLALVEPQKNTRKPRNPRTPSAPGVVTQVRTALQRRNALATLIGAILGGFVPCATYVIAHGEVARTSHGYAMLALVIGGLVFSAKTVWQWASLAFRDPWKATGFAMLIEGAMTLSSNQTLTLVALGLLAGINAIATGVSLSRHG